MTAAPRAGNQVLAMRAISLEDDKGGTALHTDAVRRATSVFACVLAGPSLLSDHEACLTARLQARSALVRVQNHPQSGDGRLTV